MDRMYTLDQIRNNVSEIAVKYGVKSVYLFGSYAKELAGSQSDIDLLIEKGLFQLAGFHLELEERLSIKVDVLTLDNLSPDFLKEIRKDEVLLYER
jgi:predicted nucleotidyltransferase